MRKQRRGRYMSDTKSSILSAAKATLVGGTVFLIPGFLAVYVLVKVFKMLRSLAVALGPRLGISGRLGGAGSGGNCSSFAAMLPGGFGGAPGHRPAVAD